MFLTVCWSFLSAEDTWAEDGFWGRCGPIACISLLHGRLPAFVTTVSAVFKVPDFLIYALRSFSIKGPPTLQRSSARPPEWFKCTFAALTTASTLKVVRSALQSQTSMSQDTLIQSLFSSSSFPCDFFSSFVCITVTRWLFFWWGLWLLWWFSFCFFKWTLSKWRGDLLSVGAQEW